MRSRPARGFTLLEAVIAVAIVAMLAAAAVPSYSTYMAKQRLRNVAELLELDLRRARAVSVEEGVTVHVSFQSGPQWCWGSNRGTPCNCGGGQPRCELADNSYKDHKGGVLLQSGQSVLFQGSIGRAQNWQRIGLSNASNQQLHIDLNPSGRPSICGSDARKGSC